LTELSAGVGFVNIGVLSGGNTGGITVRPTLVRTSPLEIYTPNTTNPLTIKNSANTAVCTISNTGDISTNGTITRNGSSVITNATVYTKSEVDTKITTSLSTYQPLLTSSTALTVSTLSLAGNISNTNTSGVTISSSVFFILLELFKNYYGKDVKDFINDNKLFPLLKEKVQILDKLKDRKIGFLIE
jgi:hypothetical protein